jgi:hypothetical protein
MIRKEERKRIQIKCTGGPERDCDDVGEDGRLKR